MIVCENKITRIEFISARFRNGAKQMFVAAASPFVRYSVITIMSRTGFRAWIKRFILLLSLMLAACSNTDKDPSMEITFVTDLGNIVILLDENIAPNTSAFFLKQLESGTFESTSIYRAGCPFYPVCCDDPLK